MGTNSTNVLSTLILSSWGKHTGQYLNCTPPPTCFSLCSSTSLPLLPSFPNPSLSSFLPLPLVPPHPLPSNSPPLLPSLSPSSLLSSSPLCLHPLAATASGPHLRDARGLGGSCPLAPGAECSSGGCGELRAFVVLGTLFAVLGRSAHRPATSLAAPPLRELNQGGSSRGGVCGATAKTRQHLAADWNLICFLSPFIRDIFIYGFEESRGPSRPSRGQVLAASRLGHTASFPLPTVTWHRKQALPRCV